MEISPESENMTEKRTLRALIATADKRWRDRFALAFMSQGCDIHTASDGFQALDLLLKHEYDFIVVDDSFSDVGPIEFSLNVRDLARNTPHMLVGGNGLARFRRVWRHCNVFFAGPKDHVLERISEAIEHGRGRGRASGMHY